MVSGANVMDFRIENLKSATLGGTRLTRRWMADLQKTVARFSALSRHELASTLCSHLGWVHAEGSGSTGVLQVAGSRLGPGGCFGPALAAAARAEHAGGRAVHVPVGVLEGASGICGHAGRTVGATRPMGPDGGGHGMKSKPKRGADRSGVKNFLQFLVGSETRPYGRVSARREIFGRFMPPPAMSRIPVRMREPRRSDHIDNAAPSATAHGSPPQVPRSDADRTPRSGRS